MKNLKSIKGKVFRIAIDGVYFSGIINLTKEEIDFPEHLETKLEKTIFNLANIFRLDNKHCFPNKNGFTLEDPHNTGVFIRINRQRSNISINIQFKGFFFTRDSAWVDMKCYMLEVIDTFAVFFRPTLIDVAQDISLKTNEILPFPDKLNTANGLIYNFNYSVSKYAQNKKNSGIIDTGFVIKNSRFKIKLYDKILENESSKNQTKKMYYNEYYKEFENVTRLELTLKQESCKRFWEEIYSYETTQEDFSLSIFKHFGVRHSARLRPNNSTDKDVSRWPKLQNWEYLFDRGERNNLINLKTINDDIFQNSNLTKEKVVSDLIQIISNEKSTSLNELIYVLRSMYKDALKILETKKSKRRFTLNTLEKLRIRVLNQGLLTNTEGVLNSGDSITSPPNRILHTNSVNYGSGISYEQ
jgi:hypothetical protein